MNTKNEENNALGYTIKAIMPALLNHGVPLLVAQFTHPGNPALFTVVIERETSIIVWTFNAEITVFTNGYYFNFDDGDQLSRVNAVRAAYAVVFEQAGMFCKQI